MESELSCFKAYDIRGRVPDELNDDIAYRIGRAYVEYLGARVVCVGHDIRLTSPALAAALSRGIQDAGADVLDLGTIGTEEIYFAAFNNDVDGGIVVTASHNPKNYNGLKLVRRGSRPISGDTGLLEIKHLAAENKFSKVSSIGEKKEFESRSAYIDHLLTYVDTENFRGLKIVVNAGNGGAGQIIDRLERFVPATFIKIHHEPDGNFPNGIPNPLLVENRQATSDAVKAHGADLGIAWDGDFDRCFLFDETGSFIEGYFIVGLLADAFLQKGTAEKIVHDPRLVWNTQEIVSRRSGVPVMSKTGHAFIKERMRAENAVYGGEMSAHHYFRDFAYCDSGMIPWLLVAELMHIQSAKLSTLVADMSRRFPVSGEINRTVVNTEALLESILNEYSRGAIDVNHVDGLSIAYEDWRFNLRMSNTEPVVRLNVESRGDSDLMRAKTDELLARIDTF